MMYRHGDVIIQPIKQIKGKKLNHLTLAEGEVTGHAHRITEGEAELYEHKGVLFLRVGEKGATVTHEEHKPLTIKEGEYKIGIQREYSPEGWRYVAD